ncbi:MAG: recombinase RecA [Patescibacteria group bacterium]
MKPKQQPDKTERILEALKEIQSRYGEGSIMRLGEMPWQAVEVIPTGSFSLDHALGVGGIPRGRVIEIFGPESSGKTTLALHVAKEAQKTGGVVAYIDAEHALDPDYVQRIGVNLNDLVLSQPDTGEQALEIVESLVRSGAFDAVVIDSVAALTPQAEIEGEMGDQQVGAQARLMSRALRKLTALVAKTKTAVIFINQIRMQIGVRFGNPETTPGGKALKFFSSVRIDVRRVAQLKKGEEVIGNRVRAKVVKNKVAPPFRTADFDLMFNEGISYEGDLLNRGVLCGVVKKSGASFSMGNTKLGVGYDNARIFLKEHSDLKDQLKKELVEKLTA